MKKKKLSYIMAHTKIDILRNIVHKIETNYEVKATKDPEMGLTMVKIREGAYQENFYLGEVLITEAAVHVEGALGLGIIQGNNPEKAYFMAVIDAAFNKGVSEVEEIKKLLLSQEESIYEKKAQDMAMIEGSRVNFNTMGE